VKKVGSISIVACVALVSALVVAPASAKSNAKFTGDAVTVAYVGDFDSLGTSFPEVPGAVKARAKAINKAGGLEDASGATHKVVATTCNSAVDPNETQACIQDAIDAGAVAVVGMNAVQSGQVLPLLEQEGIPSIGTAIFGPADASSPASFPLGSGVAGMFQALPQLLAQQGAKKISYIIPDLGATTAAVLLFVDQGLALSGAEKGETVLVPPDATDLAPYIATGTADGVDGVVAYLIGDAQVTLVQQLRNQGYDGLIATQGGLLTQAMLDSAGSDANGMLVAGLYPPYTDTSVPGIKQFRKEMKAYDPDLDPNDAALNAWTSMLVFQDVAETLATIDRPSLQAAMGTLDGLDTGGITPPFTTTELGTVPLLSRMFNPTVTFSSIKKGKVKSLQPGFFDPFLGEKVVS
jgi:branched-chain amino acid transport system substrate-binding protein